VKPAGLEVLPASRTMRYGGALICRTGTGLSMKKEQRIDGFMDRACTAVPLAATKAVSIAIDLPSTTR
jgi:hypothetical protein